MVVDMIDGGYYDSVQKTRPFDAKTKVILTRDDIKPIINDLLSEMNNMQEYIENNKFIIIYSEAFDINEDVFNSENINDLDPEIINWMFENNIIYRITTRDYSIPIAKNKTWKDDTMWFIEFDKQKDAIAFKLKWLSGDH